MTTPSPEAINQLRDVLFAAWAKAEPEHRVTLYPASYMASFRDMAVAAFPLMEARAKAEALREAGTVEWGVQYESAHGKPAVIDHLSETQARDHYLVTRRVGMPPGVVVYRITGPWAAVEG